MPFWCFVSIKHHKNPLNLDPYLDPLYLRVMKVRLLFKKKSKSHKEGLIYIALYLGDTTELISTGQRIPEREWSKNDNKVKAHLGNVYKEIEKIKSKVDDAITRLQARKVDIITPMLVKEEFMADHKGKVGKQMAEDLISKKGQLPLKHIATQWLENNLFKYKISTQKAVKESMNQFLDFVARRHGHVLQSELDEQLIAGYEKYLQNERKLANSTHGKRMKHLRWFLNTIGYDVRKIKIRRSKKEIISLSQDELNLLDRVDVASNSKWQKAKDLFLLGCYTGLRISDIKRINPTMIVNGRVNMVLKKNNRQVGIPLLPQAKAILDRYSYRAPKINDQAVNSCIKEVCKKAGIDTRITLRTNIAGEDLDKVCPKYEAVTSHMASKTFISLAPAWKNLSPAEVAAIVGKDVKTLLSHYYELPLESAIKKMEAK